MAIVMPAKLRERGWDSIVQIDVIALQGKIAVESQVGCGTTFKVQLPLVLSARHAASIASRDNMEHRLDVN
jgi:chemotaxis protein histidine kinase CheA